MPAEDRTKATEGIDSAKAAAKVFESGVQAAIQKCGDPDLVADLCDCAKHMIKARYPRFKYDSSTD